jgi:hypothetical protein
MDATKRMYINEIMRRSNFDDDFESFWDFTNETDEKDKLKSEERRMMS